MKKKTNQKRFCVAKTMRVHSIAKDSKDKSIYTKKTQREQSTTHIHYCYC